MRIQDIRATTVTVPLEAPLRHANGCHWGRFVRTIVEVETDNGLIGLGEMGGGGESAEAVFSRDEAVSGGARSGSPGGMRFLIANPTASLYNNRTQILAAMEFACLDILGQAWGVPVCEHSRRTAAGPCSVCLVLFFSLSRIRELARARFGPSSKWWNTRAS